MLHPRGVVVAHGQRRVIERGQQILPHIPHEGGVLLQAHEDKAQVVAIQFQKAGFHHLGGLIVACDFVV